MSNVNIKRAVENIRANTTVYTPVVEMIVNAIQAIEATLRTDGKVFIRVIRHNQTELDGSRPDVKSFEIEDNGIGFTQAHRDSFDTLYTDLKFTDGGKGFGRFTSLKYFDDLHINSIYRQNDSFINRRFSLGKDHDIIVNEKAEETDIQKSGTIVTLSALKKGHDFEKKLKTIGRNLVERLLPYFITQGYTCPELVLSEKSGEDAIRLNDFVSNELSGVIREIIVANNTFTRQAASTAEEFKVRIFKFYAPRNQKSKISLVAHKREVSGSMLQKYIPEFEDEFYEKNSHGDVDCERNYIIKAYVFSPYLDRNVSLERGGFEFQMERDLLLGIAQGEIESDAALIAKEAMGPDIINRQEKKRECVQTYVDNEAPWHKAILSKIDLSGMPLHPTNEEIEARLQKAKFVQELAIKKDVAELLSNQNFNDLKKSVLDIVGTISDSSKNELTHYIALRRSILDIFGKSLESDETDKYASEGVVHDIIFPRKGDTDVTSFDEHNLWILDERLNFTNFVSSDVPLDGNKTDRPDLLVYNKRVLFRGDNESSNPITIFEFKKPQRDDFVNQSSPEDPVEQIVRYVNNIRDGKYKTREGRKMLVGENTPFYGYVVCDLTPKVEAWLNREQDFKPMPDRLGWFRWFGNINLYIEVISWDKILKDAKMRNQIFFQKLGI